MSLKSSFATVLRTLRSKRNISQRDFGDTSRTYLSKLEGGQCSITLDKLDSVSQRLELSPLTMLTLTLSQESGKPAVELIDHLRLEIESLNCDGGTPGLDQAMQGTEVRMPRTLQTSDASHALESEIGFPTPEGTGHPARSPHKRKKNRAEQTQRLKTDSISCMLSR